MSRLISYLIIFFVILLVVLGIYFSKQSYRLLPIDQEPTDKQVSQALDWHPFKAPNDQFTVFFPVLPQHATQKIKDSTAKENKKYDMFVSEKSDGTVFMVSMITHEKAKSIDEVNKILKNVKNEMQNANPNNAVTKEHEGTFKGYPSIDFTITNDKRLIETKAFFVDNTLFALTEISPKETYDPNEFDFFINSFELSSIPGLENRQESINSGRSR